MEKGTLQDPRGVSKDVSSPGHGHWRNGFLEGFQFITNINTCISNSITSVTWTKRNREGVGFREEICYTALFIDCEEVRDEVEYHSLRIYVTEYSYNFISL
jgi:hypothetical protein